MRIEKIIVFLALFAVLATAVFAATVTHPAENIRAGIFGNAYAGNWSFINGSVGIGTTSPTATLQVNSSNADGAFKITNLTGTNLFFVSGSSGNVGIGTTAPNATLHVVGTEPAAYFTKAGNGTGSIRVYPGGTGIVGSIESFGTSDLTNFNRIRMTAQSGGPHIIISDAGGTGTKRDIDIYSGSSGQLYLKTDGNVGIGTTTPNYLLQINSSDRALNVSGVLYVNGSSGNIGIGTTSPGAKLDVVGGVNGTNMFIRNSAGQTINYLSFYENTGNQWNIGNYGTTDFTIWKNGEGLPALYFKSGNVGINTTNPTSNLHVIGTGNFSGNLYAGSCTGTNKLCSDIAETIASSSKLEPGDVVVIDTAGNERIKKSNEPYDTKVAGIVSSSPAIVLKGDQALLGREVFDYKDDVPLALAGRVPVKATAENGAIKAGDLLTTSSIPGHAMKCNDKIKCIGAIVGKALEPLDSGSGKITALVTLQ